MGVRDMNKLAAFLAATLLVGGAASPSHAASLTKTYTNFVDYMSSNWDGPKISFFDSSLGKLTGVHIDYAGSVEQDIIGNFYNDETGEPVTPTLLYNISGTRYLGLNGSLLTVNYNQDGSWQFVPHGIGTDAIWAEAFLFSTDIAQSELVNFVGVGTISPSGDWINRFTNKGAILGDGEVGGYSRQEDGLAEKLTITYTYTTAAVPEPASWALMVGGFGAIGAALRQRRSARLQTA
jgi:hypothetical protein